ncbi:MAG: ABC transporter permease [Dehalococcoidia bacterium]|nr:ABC transporter permease [Dehalococcoidia bacterium]
MAISTDLSASVFPRHAGRRGGVWRGLGRFMRAKPLGAIGAAMIVALVAVAALASVIAPYDPIAILRGRMFLPPQAGNILGTDNLGRDQLSRILWGAQVSLYVGIGAVAVGTTLGAVVGLVSSYVGGVFDALVQRVIDAVMAFPILVLALVIASVLGPSVNNVLLAIAIVLVPQASRIVRSAGLGVKEAQFVEAARALGASPLRIMALHILPQCVAPYLIVATAAVGNAIIVEASISFVGAGPPPPTATWGNMLSGAARQYAERAPWLVVYPGAAITLAVFGFNLLGDALRDVLDPRLRGR